MTAVIQQDSLCEARNALEIKHLETNLLMKVVDRLTKMHTLSMSQQVSDPYPCIGTSSSLSNVSTV